MNCYMRRNSDEEVRRLERSVASGDRSSAVRLDLEYYRRSDPSILGWLVKGWLDFDTRHEGGRYEPTPGVLAAREAGRQTIEVNAVGSRLFRNMYWSARVGGHMLHVGYRDNSNYEQWLGHELFLESEINRAGYRTSWHTGEDGRPEALYAHLDSGRIQLASDLHEIYVQILREARAADRKSVVGNPVEEDLVLASVVEEGILFETGVPVTFRFLRNTEKSPNFGAQFQQDREPAGRYMIHNENPGDLARGWESGLVTFERPLVLRFSGTGFYDATSWKARLAERYGAKGLALSRVLLAEGWDGIVTVGTFQHLGKEYVDTREIVDLRPVRSWNTGRQGPCISGGDLPSSFSFPTLAEQEVAVRTLDSAERKTDALLLKAERIGQLSREMRFAFAKVFGSPGELHKRLRNSGYALGQLLSVESRVNPDAHFWIQRSGDEEYVGRPFRRTTRTFLEAETEEEWEARKHAVTHGPRPPREGLDPRNHLAVTVLRPDVLLPDYAYYVAEYAWRAGLYKRLCRGTLRLQHVGKADVLAVLSLVLSSRKESR